MNYSVSDFYNVFKEKLLLLAGEGGLSRSVNSVGILDYELDPSVKDRFICDNFHSDMVVISTFLYAKKNPYLIADAVRHLIGKGCSALLIRNVFNLPIPETVLRYADSKDFPIMVVNGSGVYFEDFVYEVRYRHALMDLIDSCEDDLNRLLSDEVSNTDVLRYTRQLVPSLKPSFFVAYAIPDITLGQEDYNRILQDYRLSDLFQASNKLLKFGNNMIFVYSSDMLSRDYEKTIFDKIYSLVSYNKQHEVHLGISSPHYYAFEFRDAILEAKYAASSRISEQRDYLLYNNLGIYRLLLPHCSSRDFVLYSNYILDPIRDYDAENETSFFETLLCYIQNDSDLKKTAVQLGQHENTIRYRLEKIHDICGLNYRINVDAEQLSIAVKIYFSLRLIQTGMNS